MPTLIIETHIAAPPALCFDLARDVDAHVETAAPTGERAVTGKTSGLLELGDEVTFEGVHFGIRQRLTARITEFDRPARFVDDMIGGAFARFRHLHEFIPTAAGTMMRDTLIWRSPFGPLGILADWLFVRAHLRAFMLQKQGALKALAEHLVNERH